MTTMELDRVSLHYAHCLWLGDILSPRFGHIEAVLNGNATAPNEGQVTALRRFLQDLDGNISRMRSQIRFGFLYRPIRIAPNMENRVGVQFRNRITGNQGTLILE